MAMGMSTWAQELPSIPSNGFAFPLGTKFTIKLHQIDSTHFDYSIIEFESFEEIIDIYDNDGLFEESGQEGTIEFYFCLGTSGDTEEERDKSMRVLLVMKNRTEHILSYESDILTTEDGEFESTSNVGVFSGAISIEMWPYMIYQIGLHDFKLFE